MVSIRYLWYLSDIYYGIYQIPMDPYGIYGNYVLYQDFQSLLMALTVQVPDGGKRSEHVEMLGCKCKILALPGQ